MTEYQERPYSADGVDTRLERALLKVVLTDGGFARVYAELLRASCFSDPRYQKIAKVSLDFATTYHRPPGQVVLEKLLHEEYGVEKAVLAIQSIPEVLAMETPEGVEFYRALARDLGLKRTLHRVAFMALEKIYEDKDGALRGASLQELVGWVTTQIRDASRTFPQAVDFPDDLELKRQVARLREAERMRPRWSSGYRELDQAFTNVGMEAPWLCLVVAPSNYGKTAFLNNLAITLQRQGANVPYYSCEMTRDASIPRLASILSSPDPFGPSRVTTREFGDRIRDVLASFQKARAMHEDGRVRRGLVPTPGGIKFFDFSGIDVKPSTVEGSLLDLRGCGWNPDVVLVDYVNEIEPDDPEPGERGYLGGGKVARQLKMLASREGVLLWSAAQLKKEVIDLIRKTGKFDEGLLGGMYQIYQRADCVVGLMPGDKDRGMSSDVVWAEILKNRHGKARIGWPMLFDRETGRMKETTTGVEA